MVIDHFDFINIISIIIAIIDHICALYKIVIQNYLRAFDMKIQLKINNSECTLKKWSHYLKKKTTKYEESLL